MALQFQLRAVLLASLLGLAASIANRHLTTAVVEPTGEVRDATRAADEAHGKVDCSTVGHMPFEQFRADFGRRYQEGTEEHEERKKIYEQRVKDIQARNCHPDIQWKAGVSTLSDFTDKELARLRDRLPSWHPQGGPGKPMSALQTGRQSQPASLPSAVSWLNNSAAQVNNIIDQGRCGSCWAMASIAVLHAHSEMYTGSMIDFAAGQLVACTPNPQSCGGTGGCHGATGQLAFHYAMHNRLELTSQWNSAGGTNSSCPASMLPVVPNPVPHPVSGTGTAPGGYGMVGWTTLATNSMSALQQAVYERGPVAVSVHAAVDWNLYMSGIFTGCSGWVVNHLVTLNGYGADTAGNLFWRVQNSWGGSWGESGHMRIQRLADEEAHCGWDNTPLDGTGCIGGPSRVWVCGTCGILYDSVVPFFQGNTTLAHVLSARRHASSSR